MSASLAFSLARRLRLREVDLIAVENDCTLVFEERENSKAHKNNITHTHVRCTMCVEKSEWKSEDEQEN